MFCLPLFFLVSLNTLPCLLEGYLNIGIYLLDSGLLPLWLFFSGNWSYNIHNYFFNLLRIKFIPLYVKFRSMAIHRYFKIVQRIWRRKVLYLSRYLPLVALPAFPEIQVFFWYHFPSVWRTALTFLVDCMLAINSQFSFIWEWFCLLFHSPPVFILQCLQFI